MSGRENREWVASRIEAEDLSLVTELSALAVLLFRADLEGGKGEEWLATS